MPRSKPLLAALAAVGLLFGIVAVGYAAGVFPIPGDDGPDDASVQSFETSGPSCARPHYGNTSTALSGPVVLKANVSVPSPATALDARVSSVGPHRYHLAVTTRTPEGAPSADCALETRYNASVALPAESGWTLVVTVDGELRRIVYSDPGHSGAYGVASSASASASAESNPADGETAAAAANSTHV